MHISRGIGVVCFFYRKMNVTKGFFSILKTNIKCVTLKKIPTIVLL